MTDVRRRDETAVQALTRVTRELGRLREGVDERHRTLAAGDQSAAESTVDRALHLIDDLAGQRDALAYERRILGTVRRTLDQVASGPITPELRAAAESQAQAIVDEIGHPATDEPAHGQTYREQLADLRVWLARCPLPLGALAGGDQGAAVDVEG